MITFFQGNSVDFNVAVLQDGVPFNVTGSKFWFTIKTNFTDSDANALLQITTESGISIFDGPNGLIIISLLPTATSVLPTDITLHCDIQILTAAGKVYTIYIDQLVVSDKVTDRLTYT